MAPASAGAEALERAIDLAATITRRDPSTSGVPYVVAGVVVLSALGFWVLASITLGMALRRRMVRWTRISSDALSVSALVDAHKQRRPHSRYAACRYSVTREQMDSPSADVTLDYPASATAAREPHAVTLDVD